MNYKDLADHSRVWIYQADRQLSDNEAAEIQLHGEQFIAQWAAHGSDLQAAFNVFYNRFLILFADESQVKASGCSIDSSVRFIKKIEKEYQLDLFDRLNLTYRKGGEINLIRMVDFQTAVDKGQLNQETTVFNNLVETKGEFENKWEVPVRESWHKGLV